MVWYGTTRTTAVAVASCISQKLRETEMVHHMCIALINILLLQSPLWLVKSFFFAGQITKFLRFVEPSRFCWRNHHFGAISGGLEHFYGQWLIMGNGD